MRPAAPVGRLVSGFWILDSGILDSRILGSWILGFWDSGSGILDSGFWILDSVYRDDGGRFAATYGSWAQERLDFSIF